MPGVVSFWAQTSLRNSETSHFIGYIINPSLHCTIDSASNGEASYLKTLSNAKVLLSWRQVHMSMQNWWNDSGRGKPKFMKKNVPSTHLSTTNHTWRGQRFTG